MGITIKKNGGGTAEVVSANVSSDLVKKAIKKPTPATIPDDEPELDPAPVQAKTPVVKKSKETIAAQIAGIEPVAGPAETVHDSVYDMADMLEEEQTDPETGEITTATATPVKSSKNVNATVTKTHADGSSEEEIIPVGVVEGIGPMASITVAVGITRNLGNYESMKFNVELTLPCQATAEDIEETFAQGKAWVDEKASLINEEITAQIG